jgi:hypothetical protein
MPGSSAEHMTTPLRRSRSGCSSPRRKSRAHHGVGSNPEGRLAVLEPAPRRGTRSPWKKRTLSKLAATRVWSPVPRSEQHPGAARTPLEVLENGRRVRGHGDVTRLGGGGVLRRVRAHRGRRHGMSSCSAVPLRRFREVRRPSILLRQDVQRIRPFVRGVAREGRRPGVLGRLTAMRVSGVGVEGTARVGTRARNDANPVRLGCNIPRAEQIPNRRGGEKPRGRKQTRSTWWWRVLGESFGSRGWVGSGSTEAGRNLRERIFKRGRPERGSRGPTGNGGKNGSRSGGNQTARRGRRKVHEGCSSIVVTHDGGEHLVFP